MANINFLRGVPADEALVPVATALSKAYAEILTEFGGKIIQYQTPGLTDFLGFHGLKETLADRFGAPGDPLKKVICSNGGMETFSFILKSLTKSSKVATDAICYDRVLIDIARNGHQCVGVPLTFDGIDLEALDTILASDDIKVYYQVGYHHNPTGITVSKANMDAAAEICAKHGVLYVLDIAYFELRYDGQKNEMIDLSSFPETTSIIGSFTKTLSPGAKCGFGIFPEQVVQDLLPVIGNTRLNPNYPTQAAINLLMINGFYDDNLNYLNNLYGERMHATNNAMQKYLPAFTVPTLTGGFFVGIWAKGVQDEKAFVEAVKAKGVTIQPSKEFAPGKKEEYFKANNAAFFRLTFPAFSPEDNDAGIKAISEAYQEMTG